MQWICSCRPSSSSGQSVLSKNARFFGILHRSIVLSLSKGFRTQKSCFVISRRFSAEKSWKATHTGTTKRTKNSRCGSSQSFNLPKSYYYIRYKFSNDRILIENVLHFWLRSGYDFSFVIYRMKIRILHSTACPSCLSCWSCQKNDPHRTT